MLQQEKISNISQPEKFNINNKQFNLIKEPLPHVLIESRKELHGWWPWENKRECTAERLLINPYNGCGIGCWFCYASALPGYFQTAREKGIVFVFKDFHKNVEEQLDQIDIASCGYLSPVTDPFQEINKKYKLSEKIIKIFVERNLPIEFITKSKIPDEAIELIKQQKHSFGQVSILTKNNELLKKLVPNSPDVTDLFENIRKMAKNNIYAVCRIDPIFPYITDKKEDLSELVTTAIDSGARHIIASVLDIPYKIYDDVIKKIGDEFSTGMKYDYKNLYTERIGYINTHINYRKRIFDFLRNVCDKKGVTFALCMEYEIKNGECIGLNREFSSSLNCEGMDVPLYVRVNKRFEPIKDCKGNCLTCKEPKCGIEELAMGKTGFSKKGFKLSDYKRWSKLIKNPILI